MRKKHLTKQDIPAALTIMGQVLPLVLKRNLKQEGDRLDACYNHHNKTIEVCTQVHPSELSKVLFHELLHIAFDLSAQKSYLDATPHLEEALVLMLENAFGHAIDISKLTAPTTKDPHE